jgi:hypothetical protein
MIDESDNTVRLSESYDGLAKNPYRKPILTLSSAKIEAK